MEPTDIDHVSAHATSTPEGDPAELAAFKTIFGDHAPQRVASRRPRAPSATPSAPPARIGAVAAIRAMRDGCIPPTLNLVDPVPGRRWPRPARRCSRASREVRAGLVNAFGFGGQNSALDLQALG